MLTKEEIYETVRNQLACEFNCILEDFMLDENIITLPALDEKLRCVFL